METKKDVTYGGLFGGILPMLVMIATVMALAVSGNCSTTTLWCACLLAVIVAFFMFKDKNVFLNSVVKGVGDPILSTLMPLLIMAFVLANIISVSGLSDVFVWVIASLNIPVFLFPLFTFLMGILISTATGSSTAANNAVAVLMIPTAYSLGIPMPIMIGAVLAGGSFGDNLAPISDTTIASALTQECEVTRAVKTRLPYSVAAGLIASFIYVVVGYMQCPSGAADLAVSFPGMTAVSFLIIPVLLIILMIKTKNFFTAMLVNITLGVIMLLVYGKITIASLVSSDGIIISGISSCTNIIVLFVLIFAVIGCVKDSGVMEVMVVKMTSGNTSIRKAEITSGIIVTGANIVLGTGLASTVFVGPFIRNFMKPLKVDRARAANFLDAFGCALVNILPWSTTLVGAVAVCQLLGVVGEDFTSIDCFYYNFYGIVLYLIYWFSMITSFGCKLEDENGEVVK